MASYRISEQKTRYNTIDPQLGKAGWNTRDRAQVGIEIPVAAYDPEPFEGITDYCLYRENGDVLAVVEAKRTCRDARVGKQQVLEYVTAIEPQQSFRPFAFMANGDDIFFWDSEVAAERHVARFFSRPDLERLLFLKQHKLPLNSVQIKSSIIDRSYQIEAVRRVSEAIEIRKKRKALIVMATGTGKTRTTMALIDVFLRAHAAQKILFLADRDALVEQALTKGFKAHLPDEARARIRTYDIDKTKRLYVSTLQTLEICYNDFSPAEFDLIVSDECHRSIYNKFTDVLAYFDAVQIGLTATPAQFIDRDTFKFFDCDNSIPTFLYTYEKAVEEKYLADFNVYAAQTKFQRKGIKGVNLTEEEKESLRERGIDPDTIDYAGTDLERKVTNRDTLRRQWEEFMDVCLKDATGQLPGKTIVFAVTYDHAMRLAETFNEMYWENFEHFNMMPKKKEGAAQLPVMVTIFNTRLQKLQHFLGNQSGDDAQRIVGDLRAEVGRIPQESFSVKKAFKEVKEAWDDDFWRYLTPNKVEFLKLKVAPLLRFVPNVNPGQAFFTSKMERCGLALVQGKDLQTHVESIREDVAALATTVEEVAAQRPLVDRLLSNEFWDNASLTSIDEAKAVLAPLMKYRNPNPSRVIELGLDDIIESRKWVILKKGAQRLYVEEYKKRVEAKIEQLANAHPTIQKLQQRAPVSTDDLVRLEHTLETALGSEEINLDEENMLKAFGVRVGSLVDFLKHILKLEELPDHETVVRRSFNAFMLAHNYNADQSRFLRAVQNVFLQRHALELADLYEEPFTNFGENAVEKLFSASEIDELLGMVKQLIA
jgi:type I site-specific restriction endonuclease